MSSSVRDLFIHGNDFTETSQYKRMVKHLSEGLSPYGCRSEDDIAHYFANLTQAYHSIKENGYQTQQQLGKSPKDEIRIHITEDGGLCLGSKGNHRIRMAQLLEIQEVPCNVYGVNINWIIALSKQTKLPPHQAFLSWMKDQKPRSSSKKTSD